MTTVNEMGSFTAVLLLTFAVVSMCFVSGLHLCLSVFFSFGKA